MSSVESADEDRVNQINRTMRATGREPNVEHEPCERPGDRQALATLEASGQMLRSRVRHLRRLVNDNGYDCPLKLSIALDRMIANVVVKP